MSDAALNLLSKTFASAMLLNADPDRVAAAIQKELPILTSEQEAKQTEVLALSENFPSSASELNAALGGKKFILGTDKPSLADLIIYARVRQPVAENWSSEEYKSNANIILWADRIQKSEILRAQKPDESAFISTAALGNKEKKTKKEKGPKPQPAKKEAAPITPALVDLRVGFIQKAVKHPDADALYVSTIEMGDSTGPRTVCSGLVKHIPLDEMQQRYVVVVANLKPVTMRGIRSEAMVLCAANEEKVELVIPPDGSKAGDKVFFEGFDGTPEPQLNPKKKIFETLQPNFTTNEKLEVVFKTEQGSRLLINKVGKVVLAPSLVSAEVR
ncbi:hypothetical protein POJ06DRAFT_235837 [Lipomyces tetrasporus]|uniref:tRNA-binding domain-containing protein n=1 Tax=Lipomyces tetrasporus TaxID=54092 RepID=A0AAD7VU95_9ASCO|nr:uncharacterized protein POJ06DRAFT_235837 [Lipomyces tetrasporus]KAJ8102892.1 hypothetical protein POJ06DRAFT_235837 [Lipomyces tetrasporus]